MSTRKIGLLKTCDFGDIAFYETNEYDQFKMYDANRSVIGGHVKRLIKSMNEELLFSPIFVDKDLRIVDGQHRFNALREIGEILIYCIIHKVGLKQVTRYNINAKNWNDDDFLSMYVNLDYKEYKTYLIFKEKYQLSHSSCKSLLGGGVGPPKKGNTSYDTFKSGEFICKSVNRAYQIAEFIDKLRFDNRKSQNFVKCLLRIDDINYDRSRMIHVINSNENRLNHGTKPTRDYLFYLSDLYNYHLGKDKRIQFFDPSIISYSK